jgi:hypothetical protein
VNARITWRNGHDFGVEGCLSIDDELYEVDHLDGLLINSKGKLVEWNR